MVKRNKNPKTHSCGLFFKKVLPFKDASQLKTLIPVGIAIIPVAAVKYSRVSVSIPTINM